MILNNHSLLTRLLSEGSVWRPSTFTPKESLKAETIYPPISSPLGLPAIDNALPHQGLKFGALHELTLEDSLSKKSSYTWHPPLLFVAHILKNAAQNLSATHRAEKQFLVWVGRKSWPTPSVLEKYLGGLGLNWRTHCLFIDPPDKNKRLLSIAQALRAKSVLGVIADGHGINFTTSRRLHLAAKNGNSLGLILRPPWEINNTSAAYTKWHLTPRPSLSDAPNGIAANESPAWNLELLRARGQGMPLRWELRLKEQLFEATLETPAMLEEQVQLFKLQS